MQETSDPSALATTDWSLDHVGHIVRNLEAASRFYCDHLGFVREEEERSEEHQVDLLFLRRATTVIELLQPHRGNLPLERFLQRKGEGLHHVCFRVTDLQKELERLNALGVDLIDKVPRPGSRGTDVAFLHPKSAFGTMIELCAARG